MLSSPEHNYHSSETPVKGSLPIDGKQRIEALETIKEKEDSTKSSDELNLLGISMEDVFDDKFSQSNHDKEISVTEKTLDNIQVESNSKSIKARFNELQ